MGHKEYTVIEIVDFLRRVLAGDSLRAIARSTGIDRNTLRRYLRIAEQRGFGMGFTGNLDDIGFAVFREVHPERSQEEATCSLREQILVPHQGKIATWLKQDKLTLTKVHIKLRRIGVEVSYSGLYRFAREHLEFGPQNTVLMKETEPGERWRKWISGAWGPSTIRWRDGTGCFAPWWSPWCTAAISTCTPPTPRS